MKTITIGGQERRIEPFSGRKVNRALRLLKAIAKAVPELLDIRAEFIRRYEAANYVELDRAQALLRYGAPVAVTTPEGELARDAEGRLETVPSPLLAMSEDAWAQTDHKLRLPRSPSTEEQLWAIFPEAFDKAEDLIVRLLALALMPNHDIKEHARKGDLDEHLGAAGEDLLDDALGDELLELAVAAGEVVDDQILAKARRLRADDRLGNALRLLGLSPESLTPSKSPDDTTPAPTPSSSTDSPEPSDGAPSASSSSTTSSTSSGD